MGHLGNLSEAQAQALGDFKKALPDVADNMALRFLRQSRFDSQASITKFREMLEWRKQNNVDTLHDNPDPEIMQIFDKVVPQVRLGTDKQGHPIIFQRTGMIPPRLMKYVCLEEMLVGHIWNMENIARRAAASSLQRGALIEASVNILDLAGLTWSSRELLPFLKIISDTDSKYYPETLHKTFLINAPSFIPALWGLIKQFLDPVVASKVSIHSSDYINALSDLIDKDVLLVEYGGHCPEKVPNICTDAVEEEFLANERRLGFEGALVPSRQLHAVTMSIVCGATVQIAYAFRTEGYDISFRVMFLSEEASPVEIVPMFKSDSHKSLAKGKTTYTASSNGRIQFVFDNLASLFTAKQVWYKVTVI